MKNNYFVMIRKYLKENNYKVNKKIFKQRYVLTEDKNDIIDLPKARYQFTSLSAVKDNCIIVMFSKPIYQYDSIYIDRKDCFDKISNCPIQLPLPTNEKEYSKVLKYLHSIHTDDSWYKISNYYEVDKWINSY